MRGVCSYRVIIPKDLRDGVCTRYFSTKAKAAEFASTLNEQRGGVVSRLASLPRPVQESVMRAVGSLGDFASRIDEAAVMFLRDQLNKPVISKTVADAMSDCIAAKEASGKSVAYVKELTSTLGSFNRAVPGALVADVIKGDVEKWLASGNWASATRRTYLIDVVTLFSFAMKEGWCGQNVAALVERPTLDERPPGIFTVEHAATLIETALLTDPPIATYIAVGLFAGLRPSEAIRFKLAHVVGDYLHVFATKTRSRRRRLVTVTPALSRILASGCEITLNNFTKRLRKVRKTAGVPWPHDVLRHSFASYHLAMHGSAEKTALELGHTETGTLFNHYRELVTKADADTFFGVVKAVKQGDAKKPRAKLKAARKPAVSTKVPATKTPRKISPRKVDSSVAAITAGVEKVSLVA